MEEVNNGGAIYASLARQTVGVLRTTYPKPDQRWTLRMLPTWREIIEN